MDLSEHRIDWDKGPSEEDLSVFDDSIPVDDRGEEKFFKNSLAARINRVRALIVKGGIPALLLYNGAKAVVVGTGAYMVCPGDMEVKAIAAGAAGVGLLSASPTFWAAGALITAKIGARALKAANTD